MTKALKKIIIIASIVAVALVSTVSFAAWTASNNTKNASITVGGVSILEFGDTNPIAISNLQPYDQTAGWTENTNYVKMSIVVAQTATATNFDITVSGYTSGLDVASSKIKYAKGAAPADENAAALVTDTLAGGTVWTGTTITTGTTTVEIFLWLESTVASDIGKTISFVLTLTQTP